MDSHDQKPDETVTPAGNSNGDTSGRRRFVRGVGVALPVIMTVKSRSVLATGGACLAPSATASIALLHSRPDRTPSLCSGRTPGYWKEACNTHLATWQLYGQVGGKDIRFTTPYSNFSWGSITGTMTHKQVMDLLGNQDPYQFGGHMSAAYLNFKAGWVPASVLDLSDLLAMWNGRNSGYTPTPGVTWYAQQIVAYLKTTMTL